ncbi:MAG TPA: M48 family metallopeptidase [Chthoniobacterales bacterium]|nr:M48 family metallopeptidase [Chthoniobacterales bacterium]
MFTLIFLSPIPAQQNSPSTPTSSVIANSFDPTEATKAWLATVPAEQRAKSDAYFEGGYWLLLWNFLVTAAIAIFLLASRWSARLRDFAQTITKFQTLQVAVYAVGYILITAVLSLPLTAYQQFFREHQYGLATQSFTPWFAEQLIGLVVALVAGTIALVVLYLVFRCAPQSWWIWGTIVAVVLSFIGNFVAPVFVEPLFNKYTPITDPKIRDSILAMARANQIPGNQVFEVDASRQTTRISANVVGMLGTTRIALNDNLINQCTLPEIRAVMAHEMGHYVLNHGAKLTIYFGIVALIGFGIARVAFDRALHHWGQHWHVRGIGDPAGFPLLVLIFATFAFLITPVRNSIVRITEREADQFGINTAREPEGEAKIALKLGTYRKLDPRPLEELIFFDHPSGRARIQMAMEWKAAHLPPGNVDAPAPEKD